jgi:hypothetical protein
MHVSFLLLFNIKKRFKYIKLKKVNIIIIGARYCNENYSFSDFTTWNTPKQADSI